MNNLIKGLSKKALGGLIFGLALAIGVVVVIAFTEPTSGPTGFQEPTSGQDKGDLFAYGRGWVPNASGDGSTVLTKAACDAAANWYWFEDGNGDGDTTDEEDGICVKATTVSAGATQSWNGDNSATAGYRDNTYIAAYTCTGNFPGGTVNTYSGINSSGNPDTTWNDGDCALCQADCYDGKKDLPDQIGQDGNAYTSPIESQTGHYGPLTPEVLKNWRGTRLPTSKDFIGFCGYQSGSDTYKTSCSPSKIYGSYGGQLGRTDECIDTANVGGWEWLSEQHYGHGARVAGTSACSDFSSDSVASDYRFRAVSRP